MRWSIFNSLLATFAMTTSAFAGPAVTLTVRAEKPGAAISPTMWGIFFEDINYGADGGLYPERVKNRSFEFPDPLMGWHLNGVNGQTRSASVRDHVSPGSDNRHHLRVASDGSDTISLTNDGFFGMGVKADQLYVFSLLARIESQHRPELAFKLIGNDGQVLVHGAFHDLSNQWTRYETVVRPRQSDPKATLTLIFQGKGTLDIDVVSLLPSKTFKGHGLRIDMAEMLAELKPGFMRFPGGCIVEGHTLNTRYQWKTTIGPVNERKLIKNRWNDEFKHRPAPDYFQSFGLGFFEFFQLCEDIGAEPLPILNCGMACQFNSGELVPLNQLDPYIQDALDLIEFANGPESSKWGAKRAAIGPSPAVQHEVTWHWQ